MTATSTPVAGPLAGILRRAGELVPCRDCGRPKPRVVLCEHCGPGLELRQRADDARRRAAAVRATLPGWDYARLSNTTWRAGVEPRVLDAVLRWRPPAGLTLLGPPGAGKSSSLVAGLHDMCDRHVAAVSRGERSWLPTVLWTSEAQLLAWSRQHRLGMGEDPDLARAAHVDMLVVDELRGEALELLPALVDRRYAHPSGQRWTAATAGFSRRELSSRYGGQFVRRLAEGGDVVDMIGR